MKVRPFIASKGVLPLNGVGRIAQQVREGEGRKEGKHEENEIFKELTSVESLKAVEKLVEKTYKYYSVRKVSDFFFSKTWWISMKRACMRRP